MVANLFGVVENPVHAVGGHGVEIMHIVVASELLDRADNAVHNYDVLHAIMVRANRASSKATKLFLRK